MSSARVRGLACIPRIRTEPALRHRGSDSGRLAERGSGIRAGTALQYFCYPQQRSDRDIDGIFGDYCISTVSVSQLADSL